MILHLQKKYDIPLAYLFGLNDYLFFNEYRSGEWERFDPAVLLPPEHILNDEDIDLEEFYKDNKEPYVKLLILSNSKKTDVIKFIRNNWERVEEILKRQNWTPKDRVRKTIYKKRNRYIKELLQKPIKELQKKVGETICTDKDILINLILQKEGFGNVNEGYIRKMNTKNTK